MIGRFPRLRWGRALVLIAVVAVLVVGGAAPASAHATLISSDPAEGAVLAEAPERIRFTFNETALGVPNGVQVFDAQGGLIASSAAVRGRDLEVTLTEQVGRGTLVVVWRLVSEDGHPVGGSLTFSIGEPSASVKLPPNHSAGAIEPPWTLTLTRWVGYVGLLLAAGLVGFAMLFLPSSHLANRARVRLVTAARVAAAATVVAWLAGLPLTVMYRFGGGPGSLADGANWSALAAVEYIVAAAVVTGVVVAVGRLGPGALSRSRGIVALAAAGLAACAPALTGHTQVARPVALAIGVDMLHLLAGSVWFGGLVALVLVLPDLSGRGAMAAEVLARFSLAAAGILAALVVTGTVLAWRIARSWSPLVDTGYGRLLLAKIAVVLIAVVIAAWNRYVLLPRMRQTTRRRERRAGGGLVLRATAAEATVLVAVLLITAVLVDRSPTAAAAGAAGSAVRTATLGGIEVRTTVSPPVIGPSTVTIELRDANGEPTEALEAPRARLASSQVDLGAVPVANMGPGVYSGQVVLPSAGTWRLQVSLRVSEFDSPVTALEFTVPGG